MKTQITATVSGKPGQGVDLNVAANQNIYQSKNQKHNIDATAEASKHVGGPLGNTKTDVTLGGQYSYNTDKVNALNYIQQALTPNVFACVDENHSICKW